MAQPLNSLIGGEKIHRLGLGTFGHGDAYGGITKEESFEILRLASDNIPEGAKAILDTAPKYGHGKVEEWVGEFAKDNKNNFLIATKGGRHIESGRVNEKDFSPKFLRQDLENSLSRLGLKQIFLYQLHNPSLEIIRKGDVFGILEKFRKEGKIKWYGVSIDEPIEGVSSIEMCKNKRYTGLVSIQAIYNILNKKASQLMFKKAAESKIAIIAREVLLRGFLTGKYNESHDFSNAPEAVKKEIQLYGKYRLFKNIENVKNLLAEHNISMTQGAISFALSNPFITTSLIGVNRISYFDEDWDSTELDLPQKLIAELNDIRDI